MIGRRKRFENPLERYSRMLRKRWTTVAVVFALTLAITVLYNMSLQPRYQTQAKILIEAATGRAGSDELSRFSKNIDYYLTQFEIIRSRPILSKVVDKLDLASQYEQAPSQLETLKARLLGHQLERRRGASRDALISMLQESVSIKPQTNAGLLVLTVRGSEPGQVRDICNTLVDTFREENLSAQMQSRFATTEFLSRQLAKLNRKIQGAEQRLEEFQRREGIQGISDPATLDTQQYAEFIEKYGETRQQVWELETRARILKEIVEREDFQGITLNELKNEQLDNLSQQLFEAELTLSRLLKQDYKEKHPLIVEARDNITLLRKQIVYEARRYIAGLEADLAVARKREQSLAEIGQKFQKTVPESFRKRSEYEYLKRDLELHRSMYEQYDQQLKQMQLADEANNTSIRVVEPALKPGRPYSPNKRMNLLIGISVGLFSGLFLAFFREYMDNTIRSVEDVAEYLEIPALGTIPVIEDARAGDVIQRRRNSSSVVSEAYRTLRTNLQFFESERPLSSIVVTSAGPSEGKSTTVANLALTLVQTGKRVCIVDTDLRKPVQHKLFKRGNEYGLTSIFAGITDKRRLLTPTGFDNLYLLACGPIPPNPAELLGSSRMHEAVRNLKKDFDYVLFDSPPALIVSDALVLSGLVDGVLLVLRAGEATIPIAQHCLDSLTSIKANVVGCVLNRFDYKQSRYYYNQYYSKYYRYGYGSSEDDAKRPAPIGASPRS